MAKKGNIRSIRFSDAMIEMIESQAGENFTAKFEALVTRCMWELPAKQAELKEIERQIKLSRSKLEKINRKAYDLESQINKLSYALDYTNRQIGEAGKCIKKIIDEA